jgi:hypothetical protein
MRCMYTVCIYIYIYVFIHIYMYISIYTYIFTCIYIGDTLIRCNGQDIQRKKTSGKTKNRIMVVMPAQLAINKGLYMYIYIYISMKVLI